MTARDRFFSDFRGGTFTGVNVFGSDATGWTFSVEQMWYPGIYDTAETCRYAATLDPAYLETLQNIWSVYGENRPATMDDLPARPATLTLNEFLLARIAEDEAVARDTTELWRPDTSPPWFDGTEKLWGLEQIKRWSPARVLAECDAKRRIVEQYKQAIGDADMPAEWNDGYVTGQEFALKLLALPYADHPDYRQEWKP